MPFPVKHARVPSIASTRRRRVPDPAAIAKLARVVINARPVLVWLADDATLRALFGKGSFHFKRHRARYAEFVFQEGGQAYVHVAEAEKYFARE